MIAVWAAASPFLPATLHALEHEDVPYMLLAAEPDGAGLAAASEAEALVVGGAQVTAELLASFPRLRLIVRGGVGVDRIDMAAATERGIMVTNVVDYGCNEVADHAMLLMLAAIRRLRYFVAQNRANWRSVDYLPVPRLHGRRLGIIGLGRIGSAVAQRARAFEMGVVAPRSPSRAPERLECPWTTCWPRAMSSACTLRSLRTPTTSSTRARSR